MKKIISIVGIAIVTALASYAIAWLKDPDNFKKASKQYSKLRKLANRKLKNVREGYSI